MYAKIENGAVVQYPYSYEDLKRENPQTSFPISMPVERLNDYGIHIVVAKGQPDHNPFTHKVVETSPAWNAIKQQWEQAFQLVELTAGEQAALKTEYQNQVTQAVQNHLDTEARTHGYDGILSLASYAASTNPPFAAEGDAGLDWRDAVWGKCYQILAEVNAGTRSIPTVEEVIAELPPMVWPNS